MREIAVRISKFILGVVYLIIGKPGISNGITAFVFHDISNNPAPHAFLTRTYCSEDLFKKQISWIAKTFKVIKPIEHPNPMNLSGAVISFDDGYLSATRFATNYLTSLGMPSIHFINPDVVKGRTNSTALAHFIATENSEEIDWSNSNPDYFRREYFSLTESQRAKLDSFSGPYANESDIDEISLNPLVTIGNHGNNHWKVDKLDNSDLVSEIRQAHNFLKLKPNYQLIFATPHASAGPEALKIITKEGFSTIFTGTKRLRNPDYFLIPRIDLNTRINSYIMFLGAIWVSKLRQGIKR